MRQHASHSAVLQRKCACGGATPSGGECEECKKKDASTLQRSAQSTSPQNAAFAPPIVDDVLRSPGQPLDHVSRAFFEPRFGHDFGHVRVHADEKSAESARSVNALAYTVGSQIVFARDQYRPTDSEGLRLMAHELTHVMQQEGQSGMDRHLRINDPGDAFEGQAMRNAATVESVRMPPQSARFDRVPHTGFLQRLSPLIGVDILPPIAAAGQIAADVAYAQALAQLQAIDPTLYSLLSKVKLNGPSATIRTATAVDNSVQPPVAIQLTFNLEAKTANLPPGSLADFDGGVVSLAGSATSKVFTASMVMRISSNSNVSLAEDLYHEGIHMLVMMDSLLPTSPHGASLANYKKIANAQPDFGLFSAELEVFIEQDLQLRKQNPAPGTAKKDADKLLSDLWEEKYVRDQEKAKFNAPFNNGDLALTYILKDLGVLGIRANASDRNLQSIVQKAAKIMTAIDQLVSQQSGPAQQQPSPNATKPSGTNPSTPGH
ncbi:MAG TPA: DUF4157 domain-containing protein [Candidatus Sulfotelmatobacter sp.]|nr:DUF4157 domain-containing protein [Candidatus Sulfotelmatobacter sp.]